MSCTENLSQDARLPAALVGCAYSGASTDRNSSSSGGTTMVQLTKRTSCTAGVPAPGAVAALQQATHE